MAVSNGPQFTIDAKDTICLGESISISATGNYSFVWNNGSTTQDITVSPTTTTTYTVTATDITNCSATRSHVLTVVVCNSIYDVALNNIQVYPNPTTGLLQVDNTSGETANLTITDLEGRVVLAVEAEGDMLLNVEHLPTGTYFIKLNLHNTQRYIKLLKL